MAIFNAILLRRGIVTHTFPRFSCPKMNVIRLQEFEFAIQHVIHKDTETPFSLSLSLSLSLSVSLSVSLSL